MLEKIKNKKILTIISLGVAVAIIGGNVIKEKYEESKTNKNGKTSIERKIMGIFPKYNTKSKKGNKSKEEIKQINKEYEEEIKRLKEEVTTDKRISNDLLNRLIMFDKWGIPRSAVKQIEIAREPIKEGDSFITFKNENIIYKYNFKNGGLSGIDINIYNDSAFQDIKDYNNLNDRFNTLYDSGRKEMKWFDETHKDNDLMWADAIESGSLILISEFLSNTSKIYLVAGVEEGERSVEINMISRIEVEEKGKVKNNINDLLGDLFK